MKQSVGTAEALVAVERPPVVAGLARRIAEVWGDADDHLRHAVQDSLELGAPRSVLSADITAAEASSSVSESAPDLTLDIV